MSKHPFFIFFCTVIHREGDKIENKIFLKKIFSVGIIFLFIGICTTTSAENITHQSTLKSRDSPIPLIFGTLGENGWYISEVKISFGFAPEGSEIFYRLDGTWIKYTGQFTVTQDGEHYLPWYWIDKEGTRWNEPALEFKIDRTPPSIELAKRAGTNNQVIFTATTSSASGIQYVEFYLDEDLQTTDTESPYQYTWTGEKNQQVYAISYNYAGLFQKSNKLNTPRSNIHNYLLFNRLLQRMYNIIIWFQQLNLN